MINNDVRDLIKALDERHEPYATAAVERLKLRKDPNNPEEYVAICEALDRYKNPPKRHPLLR